MIPNSTLATNGRICSGCRQKLIRFGFFVRKFDRKRIARYRCPSCKKTTSDSTSNALYRQKKPFLNKWIYKLLVGGYSQRRVAIDLEINRKTVVRKFIFLGIAARHALSATNLLAPKVRHMQFDDVETFVHTKCKPVSITLAVEHGTRRILGFEVSQMPCKGRLAKVSRKKYGPRADHRAIARDKLFGEIKELIDRDALIESDMNPHYPRSVNKHFPFGIHRAHKGRRACVVGQGELKRGGFDPLFSLNHTCAMLRANINRLFRRTWCTTKLQQRLELHIALYALRHNLKLVRRSVA
jgi:hypothetical protein